MRCTRVSKSVRRDDRRNPSPFGCCAKNEKRVLPRERLTPGSEEKVRRAIALRTERWPPSHEIGLDSVARECSERDHPLFIAFTRQGDDVAHTVRPNVIDGQHRRLTHAGTGGIQKLKQRPVAQPDRRIRWRRFDEERDVVDCQRFGQSKGPVGRENRPRWVVDGDAFRNEIAMK
ncbi:unannotated protein [freshwater metagenome]|uniref:Unannotated protein n=1 Tax=freshwater metagenome TaxID=449393 RepID=A0A6J6FN90_9ZZZZ